MLDDARMGKSMSIEGVRTVVVELLDTLLANTTASLWLTHLRDRERYTALHSINCAIFAMVFGRHEGLGREALETLGMGAMLHDIGKMKLPRRVLIKEGPLDEAEQAQMKAHPEEGYRMLRQTGGLPDQVLTIVRQHHERINGSGYPRGLSGDEVDPQALIVGLVDSYDAMTGDWPYSPPVSPHVALSRLRAEGPSLYGRDLIERFIRCMGVYPIGTVVRLNTGATGIVLSHSRSHRLRPVLMMIEDAEGNPYRRRPLVNLAEEEASGGQPDWNIEEVVDPVRFGDQKLRSITAAETIL
jgi:putative nucleotidyltransferase with HDIG domain